MLNYGPVNESSSYAFLASWPYALVTRELPLVTAFLSTALKSKKEKGLVSTLGTEISIVDVMIL